jgi:hypothetical protein
MIKPKWSYGQAVDHERIKNELEEEHRRFGFSPHRRDVKLQRRLLCKSRPAVTGAAMGRRIP